MSKKKENPSEVHPISFQTEFSVNVWQGIIDNKLAGLYFLPPCLNSALFLEFPEENLFNYLEDTPLNLREQMWFQTDGAPAHYGLNVQQWQNNNYPRRWIGRLNRT